MFPNSNFTLEIVTIFFNDKNTSSLLFLQGFDLSPALCIQSLICSITFWSHYTYIHSFFSLYPWLICTHLVTLTLKLTCIHTFMTCPLPNILCALPNPSHTCMNYPIPLYPRQLQYRVENVFCLACSYKVHCLHTVGPVYLFLPDILPGSLTCSWEFHNKICKHTHPVTKQQIHTQWIVAGCLKQLLKWLPNNQAFTWTAWTLPLNSLSLLASWT